MKDIKNKLKCGKRGSVTAVLIDRDETGPSLALSFDLARLASRLSYPAIDRGPYAHEYRVLRPISEFDRHLPKFGHVFSLPLLFSSPDQRDNDRPNIFARPFLRDAVINADPPLGLLRYSRDDSLTPSSFFLCLYLALS